MGEEETAPGLISNFCDISQISSFVVKPHTTLDGIRRMGKTLNLVVTLTGRTKDPTDRIGFGLSRTVKKHLDFKVPKVFFRWGRAKRSGFYQPSKNNKINLEVYIKCRKTYIRKFMNRIDTPNTGRPKRQWLTADVDDLLESRCSRNPPTFTNIAKQLNRAHRRIGTPLQFPFTARELLNKWQSMFPASNDANRTVQYMDDLKQLWPGLHFHTEKDHGKDLDSTPKLVGLHIVWPWTVQVLNTLAPNIFCDATYNVTVFHYRVVMITCLDGNRQHRPLMCSFITRSTAPAWATIFDIFKRKWVHHHKCHSHPRICPSRSYVPQNSLICPSPSRICPSICQGDRRN